MYLIRPVKKFMLHFACKIMYKIIIKNKAFNFLYIYIYYIPYLHICRYHFTNQFLNFLIFLLSYLNHVNVKHIFIVLIDVPNDE